MVGTSAMKEVTIQWVLNWNFYEDSGVWAVQNSFSLFQIVFDWNTFYIKIRLKHLSCFFISLEVKLSILIWSKTKIYHEVLFQKKGKCLKTIFTKFEVNENINLNISDYSESSTGILGAKIKLVDTSSHRLLLLNPLKLA